jgi:hypothetical protein
MYIADSGCAGAPGVYFDPDSNTWTVTCTGCGAKATSDADRDASITNWNTEQSCSTTVFDQP